MAFSIEVGDAFARFVFAHDGGGFTSRDSVGFFHKGLLGKLSARGWINDTGIKKRVKNGGGRMKYATVWEITKEGKIAAECLVRREVGLDD